MKYICNGCADAPPCKLTAGGADIAPNCCPFGDGTSKWEKRKPKAKKPTNHASILGKARALTAKSYGAISAAI